MKPALCFQRLPGNFPWRKLAQAILLPALLIATSCISKKDAAAQARMAYLAGQRDAIAQLNQRPGANQTPTNNLPSNITFIGPVANPVIPWTQGLTLAKAILAAVYNSQIDPVALTIHRNHEEVQVDPARLLSGTDFPLQPGDVVQFQLPAQ